MVRNYYHFPLINPVLACFLFFLFFFRLTELMFYLVTLAIPSATCSLCSLPNSNTGALSWQDKITLLQPKSLTINYWVTYITLNFGAIFDHCPLYKEMIQHSVLIHTHKVLFYPGLRGKKTLNKKHVFMSSKFFWWTKRQKKHSLVLLIVICSSMLSKTALRFDGTHNMYIVKMFCVKIKTQQISPRFYTWIN